VSRHSPPPPPRGRGATAVGQPHRRR
jgi:hypothetical protein